MLFKIRMVKFIYSYSVVRIIAMQLRTCNPSPCNKGACAMKGGLACCTCKVVNGHVTAVGTWCEEGI